MFVCHFALGASFCCHIANSIRGECRIRTPCHCLPRWGQLPSGYMDATRTALRDHVLEHSLRTGSFTLKSGRSSRFFLDTKQTACRPEGILLVADAALQVIPEDATAIGGLTMGADPVAFGIAAIAATRGRHLRCFSVRKEAKDHGVIGRIAGPLEPGDRVVVTEDTVTRGTSVMEAVDVIVAIGATPVAIVVIADRGRHVRGDGCGARHSVLSAADRTRSRVRVRRMRSSRISAITFDFWNTVIYAVDPTGQWRADAWLDLLAADGHVVDREQITVVFQAAWKMHHRAWTDNVQHSGPTFASAAVDALARDLSPSLRTQLIEAFMHEGDGAQFVPCPGVADALSGLKARGVLIGIVRMSASLRRSDCADYSTVTASSGSSMGGRSPMMSVVNKPAPEIFEHRLVYLGSSPARSAHIGDIRRTDIAAPAPSALRRSAIGTSSDDRAQKLTSRRTMSSITMTSCSSVSVWHERRRFSQLDALRSGRSRSS